MCWARTPPIRSPPGARRRSWPARPSRSRRVSMRRLIITGGPALATDVTGVRRPGQGDQQHPCARGAGMGFREGTAKFSALGQAGCRGRPAVRPQGARAAARGGTPRAITVDKNAAYPAAVTAIKRDGELWRFSRLRQIKYLNNIVEQDPRRIKRLVRPGLGFGSLQTARRTLAGYEGMAMIRKGQVRNIGGGDMRAQATGLVVSIPREHGPGRQGLASVRSRRVAAA